jgi:hypothetical protein
LIDQFKASAEPHDILWFLQVNWFVKQLADELIPRRWILCNAGGECFRPFFPETRHRSKGDGRNPKERIHWGVGVV